MDRNARFTHFVETGFKGHGDGKGRVSLPGGA
jgi:hypothetical protein